MFSVLLIVDQVDLNPALAPVYTECLRLCGNWLAETCQESPGIILEKYLERVGGWKMYQNNLANVAFSVTVLVYSPQPTWASHTQPDSAQGFLHSRKFFLSNIALVLAKGV